MNGFPYEKQTVANPNPIARFSHRARLRKSKKLALPYLTGGATLLDYGCGEGRFLHELAAELNGQTGATLIGYDPYLTAQFDGYRVVSDPTAIAAESVDILTCLEVCEHLTDAETEEFINFALKVLKPGSKLLVSVPIEIGPAVLMKIPTRSLLHRARPDVTVSEFFKSAFFAKPARRADDVKSSHRGFDWRATRDTLARNFSCEHIEFSPLPYKGWYGQSQVLMLLKK